MANIGFRIRREIDRPSRELIEGFKGLPTSNIADCMNRLSCLSSVIRPYSKAPLMGSALTVRCTGGDNLLFHKALDMAIPGDVLVIADGGTEQRSCCGEIMVRYAIWRGLAGFVVDGCIRDTDAIAELDFPVYARGVTPNGPYKNGPGEINFPVSCGGVVIHPGDILIGDCDGIAVIRPEEAKTLAGEVRKLTEKEGNILANIASLERSWVDKALADKGCEFV